jgi:hypothetical protein
MRVVVARKFKVEVEVRGESCMVFEVFVRIRVVEVCWGVRLSKAKVLAKLPTACTVDSVVIGRIKGRRVVCSRGVLWS